eukprot:gene236-109_t
MGACVGRVASQQRGRSVGTTSSGERWATGEAVVSPDEGARPELTQPRGAAATQSGNADRFLSAETALFHARGAENPDLSGAEEDDVQKPNDALAKKTRRTPVALAELNALSGFDFTDKVVDFLLLIGGREENPLTLRIVGHPEKPYVRFRGLNVRLGSRKVTTVEIAGEGGSCTAPAKALRVELLVPDVATQATEAAQAAASSSSQTQPGPVRVALRKEVLVLRLTCMGGDLPIVGQGSEYHREERPGCSRITCPTVVPVSGSMLNGFPQPMVTTLPYSNPTLGKTISGGSSATAISGDGAKPDGRVPAKTEGDGGDEEAVDADIEGLLCLPAPSAGPGGASGPSGPSGPSAEADQARDARFTMQGVGQVSAGAISGVPPPLHAKPTSSSLGGQFCPVCFEEFCYLEDRGNDRRHYDHVTKCIIKPCGHALCTQCLVNLCQVRAKCKCNCRWKGNCPLCRQPLYLRASVVFAKRDPRGKGASTAEPGSTHVGGTRIPEASDIRVFACVYCADDDDGCQRPL